jgi:hypothetical protein
MSDENIVFNGNTFAEETMTGNLAAFSDAGILLDLNEGPDPCFISNLTSVQIDELRETDIRA